MPDFIDLKVLLCVLTHQHALYIGIYMCAHIHEQTYTAHTHTHLAHLQVPFRYGAYPYFYNLTHTCTCTHTSKVAVFIQVQYSYNFSIHSLICIRIHMITCIHTNQLFYGVYSRYVQVTCLVNMLTSPPSHFAYVHTLQAFSRYTVQQCLLIVYSCSILYTPTTHMHT